MGLSRSAIAYLMEEGQRRPFGGAVLTLGVQNVSISEAEIEALGDEKGFALAPRPTTARPPLVAGRASADWLFRRLGFDEVVELDASGFEGADLVFDLNEPTPPPDHAGRYEMVVDAGTLEHVFHLPNALKNVLNLTTADGRIVHFAPSSNHIDHGFYMFSPTFFWDFYSANGLNIVRCDLCRYDFRTADRAPWLYGIYTPGSLDRQSFGGLGPGCFGVSVIVEKTGRIDSIAIPQQGMYVKAWRSAATARKAGTPPKPRRRRRPLFAGIDRWLRALRARFPLRPARWL